MNDRTPFNIFSSRFLEYVEKRESVLLSTYEVGLVGPFRVEPRGMEFAVLREADDELQAITSFVDTALLLASALPLAAAGSRYWCQQEEVDGEVFQALKTVHNPSGPTTLGRLSQHSEEVLVVLSLLDHLVRSPASLAFLIEAAPREALTQAEAILKRRLPRGHD